MQGSRDSRVPYNSRLDQNSEFELHYVIVYMKVWQAQKG